MIARLKRWLPRLLTLLGILIGLAFAARKATKEAQRQAKHEAKELEHRRNNRLREADRESDLADAARLRASHAREATKRRMEEAADADENLASVAHRFNARVLAFRANAESMDGTGTGL